MPVPLQQEVGPILGRLREPIVEAIFGAWDDWRGSPHFGVWRCKRSRANFVWEQIIERAHLAFDGVAGIHIIDGQETFKFLADDRVLFRFKKGDDAGVSANIPTQLALAFHDHGQDLLGLPMVHRVEVVYQLNRLETEIADIIVVARDEEVVVWTYSLLDTGEGVVPLPVPGPTDEPTAKPAARLVRPRDASAPSERKKRD